jgi:hypothetical protein
VEHELTHRLSMRATDEEQCQHVLHGVPAGA